MAGHHGGDLTPGVTATITYSITVNNPDTGDKRLTNTVTSAATGSDCQAGSTDLACTAAVLDLIPALILTKTATVSTTTPGSTVGYTITVADTGQTSYAEAQVTDTLVGVLGDAAYNSDATASAGTIGYVSPVLTWTGNLDPGHSVTIRYSVTVNDPDTDGRMLANSVVSLDPGSDAFYDITGFASTLGSAIFSTAPETNLSGDPQPVVSAAKVGGITSATWDPLIDVNVPATTVAGQYTATIVHSVS